MKLIECGWRDQLKEYCKGVLAGWSFTLAEIIKTKGLEQISVEELVSEITPRGRGLLSTMAAYDAATVPDSVKAELLQRIRKFLATTST